MRRLTLAAFAAACLLASRCGPGLVSEVEAATFTQASMSASIFYDGLAPYGHWVNEANNGWCWSPDQVDVTWRPYVDGYWVYTDFGWTWVTAEPWGWACYHYGRWLDDPTYGWLWVPGPDWAPAWVAWRESDDWVGWAPLPPNATWGGWSGLAFQTASVPAPNWCFVERSSFADPRPRVASIARNLTLLSRTRDATRFELRDGRPVDVGISVAGFERETGRRLPRARIVDAASPGRAPWQASRQGILAFYRPRVRSEPGAMPTSRAIRRPDSRAFEQHAARERQRFQNPWNRKMHPQEPAEEVRSEPRAKDDRVKGKHESHGG